MPSCLPGIAAEEVGASISTLRTSAFPTVLQFYPCMVSEKALRLVADSEDEGPGREDEVHESHEIQEVQEGQIRDELAEGLAAIEDLVAGRGIPSEAEMAPSRPATGGPSILTEPAVLVASGEDAVEDVRHLVFRYQRLRSLDLPGTVDFVRLSGLEVLSLSHNELRDLDPLRPLVALREVNLNFNQVEDLSPLYECEQLTKAFIAHNRVRNISGMESGCCRLEELSLLGNQLSSDKLQDILNTLVALPQLRSLDVAENEAFDSPAARQRLLEALRPLTSLALVDGEPLDAASTGGKTPPTSAPQSEGNKPDSRGGRSPSASPPGTGAGSPGAESPAEQIQPGAASPDASPRVARPGAASPDASPRVVRPGTAPTGAARVRPPLPPRAPAGGGYPAPALPPLGGSLRSSRASKIDEVLTGSSEVAQPTGSPRQMMQVLMVHAEALKRRLETQQAERDNLRFQLRLLQRDESERQPSWLEQQVAYLEAENRNSAAVHDESERLTRRMKAVEAALAEVDAEPSQVKAVAAEVQAPEEDEDDLDLARWECRNVERRLEQARSYNRTLMEELCRKRNHDEPLEEASAEEDPEMANMVSQNTEMLR
ncbi:inlA, partial [Symbiodinium natans]